jgi:hypothetical protein
MIVRLHSAEANSGWRSGPKREWKPMPLTRCITDMRVGVVHGRNATEAAKCVVSEAIRFEPRRTTS